MECCAPPMLPVRQDRGRTAIIYDEPSAGMCLPPPCCACVKARSHSRVNEDSLEYNRPSFNICRCAVMDSVTKIYLDVPPLAPCCFGHIEPIITSHKDSCYCAGFIPCHIIFDNCIKPLYGEMVCIAPCFCPKFGCETLCIRSCSIPLVGGLTNGENFKEIITAQRKKLQLANVKP